MATTDLNQLWVKWAVQALTEDNNNYETYEDYYKGDHSLAFATDRWTETFGTEFEEFSDNWCQVVVDAVVQRMEITGWRADEDAGEEGKRLVKQAEELWDSQALDVEEIDLTTQTLVKGDGYLICWPTPGSEIANATAELYYNDPVDVAVYYDPANRRNMARATKRYMDEEGLVHLMLYTHEQIIHYNLPTSWTPEQVAMFGLQGGSPEIAVSGGWQLISEEKNPYHQIPVFHFKNRSNGSTHGTSELVTVIPMQNAVNKLLMDLLVGSEFGSFRQKHITGGAAPVNSDGTKGWRAGADRVWHTTDPLARFGEFGQIDLTQIFNSVDAVVAHIAKITQTPLHYLRSSGDMPSGEALKTAESGLVHKIIAKQKAFGHTWGRAMMFALQIENGGKLDLTSRQLKLRPVWKSAETRHDLEQAQVAQLKSILGIPLEVLWAEHFNYSQEEITEFKSINKAVAATVLADVIAQAGQLPPGVDQAGVGADPTQIAQLLSQGASAAGSADPNAAPNYSQLLALLPKSATGQTSAGEATVKPQPSTKPPASPTRRKSGTGYKD